MKRAGGPTTPADIGLAPDFYAAAVRNARFLRDRYTFLDLADDSGHLARLWPTGRAFSAVARQKQRLTQQERHAQIAALLRHEGTVRIATLAKAFDVTTETVRRDLDELAESGALKRTYGGGASRSLTDEPGIGVRSRTHAAERGGDRPRGGRHGRAPATR